MFQASCRRQSERAEIQGDRPCKGDVSTYLRRCTWTMDLFTSVTVGMIRVATSALPPAFAAFLAAFFAAFLACARLAFALLAEPWPFMLDAKTAAEFLREP